MHALYSHSQEHGIYPPAIQPFTNFQAKRGYKPAELAEMKAQDPETFRETACMPTQMRSYPADPGCTHDVKNRKCFCIDKCAEYLVHEIEAQFDEEDPATTSVKAKFHKEVTRLARENTFSIIAPPIMKNVALEYRVPGIWHCVHNCEHAMWILIMDAAATYGVIDELQTAMIDLGLPHIKVAAVPRPKKPGVGFDACNMEAVIDAQDEANRQVKASEESAQDCAKRSSMTGNEMVLVLAAFDFVSTRLKKAVAVKNALRFSKWQTSMELAISHFNQGKALALADIWATNKAVEMGTHFRSWADEVSDNMGKQVGLPYNGREYIAILPAHWLIEPDHLQEHSSNMWEKHGIAPGAGTDATTEMVFFD